MSAWRSASARAARAPSRVALLIEGEGGDRAALLVDVIQGQRQVVIKSLEANYRHVPGRRRGDHPRRRPGRPDPGHRRHRPQAERLPHAAENLPMLSQTSRTGCGPHPCYESPAEASSASRRRTSRDRRACCGRRRHRLPAGKATLVYSRLAKRLRALGLRISATMSPCLASPAGEPTSAARWSAR